MKGKILVGFLIMVGLGLSVSQSASAGDNTLVSIVLDNEARGTIEGIKIPVNTIIQINDSEYVVTKVIGDTLNIILKNGEPLVFVGYGDINIVNGHDDIFQINIQFPLIPTDEDLTGGTVELIQSDCIVNSSGDWECKYKIKVTDRWDNLVSDELLGRWGQMHVCSTNSVYDRYCH